MSTHVDAGSGAGNTTNSSGTTSSSVRAANVSVTNIHFGTKASSGDDAAADGGAGPLAAATTTVITNGNAPGGVYFSASASPVRICVPKMEEDDADSDAELAQIEHSNAAAAAVDAVNATPVNMRTASATAATAAIPRPMSWEGELSDADDDEGMDTKDAAGAAVLSIAAASASLGNAVKLEPDTHDSMAAQHLLRIHQQQQQQHNHHQQQQHLSFQPQQQQQLLHQRTAAAAVAAAAAAAKPQTQQQPPASSAASYPPANHSPDSAIHSVYTHSSPSQSPITSRHSALYTSSLSRNNSDASHSSCYSYSSEFSPTHSPIQGRHPIYPTAGGAFNGSPLHHSVLYRPLLEVAQQQQQQQQQHLQQQQHHQQHQQQHHSSIAHGSHTSHAEAAAAAALDSDLLKAQQPGDGADAAAAAAAASLAFSAGISRQQLINSPCPICGDKISGFHYGIFSCESCKGFFKRTVQNRKNYVCLRGAACPVTIATRKKCPACRFEKCLQRGMKLEAIREDRTRGGRSTYQCAYALPGAMLSPPLGGGGGQTMTTGGAGGSMMGGGSAGSESQQQHQQNHSAGGFAMSGGGFGAGSAGGSGTQQQQQQQQQMFGGPNDGSGAEHGRTPVASNKVVPTLLQEIMDVEHLWQYSENERINQAPRASATATSAAPAVGDAAAAAPLVVTINNPLLANVSQAGGDTNPSVIANLCNVADHRLYKIVKWCKSLPLFKHISIDDQICLLINSWCELLLFSCCYRSIETPGEVRISFGKSISLAQAKVNGLQACIERMLNLTDHLRRLRVDKYEYVAMKVIVLLQSDTSELKEPEKVRGSQEKALQALQAYTLAHYADSPAKFGELLLRIPELQRTCQIGKEMLTIKSKDGEDFNLLMELLRGEH